MCWPDSEAVCEFAVNIELNLGSRPLCWPEGEEVCERAVNIELHLGSRRLCWPDCAPPPKQCVDRDQCVDITRRWCGGRRR